MSDFAPNLFSAVQLGSLRSSMLSAIDAIDDLETPIQALLGIEDLLENTVGLTPTASLQMDRSHMRALLAVVNTRLLQDINSLKQQRGDLLAGLLELDGVRPDLHRTAAVS